MTAPPHVNAGDALRRLGLRDAVHPLDVFASLYPSREVADACAAGNLERYGHATLGTYEVSEGVVGVLDLRHRRREPVDPSLPDDITPVPAGKEGGI